MLALCLCLIISRVNKTPTISNWFRIKRKHRLGSAQRMGQSAVNFSKQKQWFCWFPSQSAAASPNISYVKLIKRNIHYPVIDFQTHLLLISLWFNLIKLSCISNIDFNKILIKIPAIIKCNFSYHSCISMELTSKTNLLSNKKKVSMYVDIQIHTHLRPFSEIEKKCPLIFSWTKTAAMSDECFKKLKLVNYLIPNK